MQSNATTALLSNPGLPGTAPQRAASLTQQQSVVASQLANRGGGPAPQPRGERAAAKTNYQSNGKKDHDLTNAADIRELISQSPQVDNNKKTTNDEVRCGGAAIFNAALLDGDHRANADALESSARNNGVRINKDQQAALDSMRDGHLNANQAAQLQDLSFKMADSSDGKQHPNSGLSTTEVSAGLLAIKNNSGLPNTQDVTVNLKNVGDTQDKNGNHTYTNHYTVTTTSKRGNNTTTADSWPGADGQATVQDGVGAPSVGSPGYGGKVVLHDGLDGKTLEVQNAIDQGGRAAFGKEGLGEADTIMSEKARIQADGSLGEVGRKFLDPQTAQPLSEKKQQEALEQVQYTQNSGNGKSAGPAEPSLLDRAKAKIQDKIQDLANTSPKDLVKKALPSNLKVVGKEVGADAALLSKDASYQGKHVQANAHVEVMSAHVSAGASAAVDLKHLKIKAEAHAGAEVDLVAAEVHASVGFGIGKVGGDAKARVGADATGQAGIGFDPRHGDINVGAAGQAFTGARANAGIDAHLGPVGVRGGVAVQAGVGIQAGVDVGLKNGKFSFNLNFGFSLGIGIRFNIGFDIDFKKIGKFFVKTFKGLKKAAKAIKNLGKKAKKAAKKAVKWMGKTAKKGIKKLGKKLKSAGKKVKNVAKKAKKKLKKLGRKLKKLF